MLIKIAYSARNYARLPLFCLNSAQYPKIFSGALSLGRGAKNVTFVLAIAPILVETVTYFIKISQNETPNINHEPFSIRFVFSFHFFFQLLRISLVLLIFRYSAQILLINALFCQQNVRLKNHLFCTKFCQQYLSNPSMQLA